MKYFFVLCAFLWMVPSFSAQARDGAWLADASLGTGYGVQIKEGRTGDDELAQIKKAGLSYVRFVIPWYSVESEKGVFIWDFFDDVVKKLRAHGLHAVIVLGAGHPLYTGEMEAPADNPDGTDHYLLAPSTPEQIKAFAHYAAQTVSHFDGQDIVWEIWNEPDSDRFWSPSADSQIYGRVALAACQAMRDVAPQARIIGPAMAATPGTGWIDSMDFLSPLMETPLTTCWDAVSFHPYRDGEMPPEKVLAAYDKARAFIKKHTPAGQRPLPIVTTEWGFTLTQMDESQQAAFLLRSYLLNSLAGIPLSIWYEWRDARAGEKDPEAHFGLLNLDRSPKESFRALKAFLPPLKGAKVEKRLAVGGQEDFVLVLQKKEKGKAVVAWTLANPAETLVYLVLKNKAQDILLTASPQNLEIGVEEPEIAIRRVGKGQ